MDYFKTDSDEEQYIQGEKTTVLSRFQFFEMIEGMITNSKEADISKNTEKLNHSLYINDEKFNGTEDKSFELIDKSEVNNAPDCIPRFTSEGHLKLPSGIEIW